MVSSGSLLSQRHPLCMSHIRMFAWERKIMLGIESNFLWYEAEELVAGYTHDQIDDMTRGAGGVQLWIVGQSLWFVITKRDGQLIHITSHPLANFFHALVEQKTTK